MPNHITSILKIRGTKKEIEKILDTIKGKEENGEEMHIDFNKIIPMPESLHITAGSSTDYGLAILKFRKNGETKELDKIMQYPWVISEGIKTHEELCEHLIEKEMADIEEAAAAIENERLYGCSDWYSFANKYWGTKWNAYSQSFEMVEGDGVKRPHAKITFDTAWSTPLPIFEKLSTMFPKVVFIVDYADEDMGCNCGTLSIEGGVAKSLYSGDGDMKAVLFAYNVKGRSLSEVLDNYLTEDVIEEDDSAFGNTAFAKELVEHFINEDEDQLRDFILDSDLSDKALDFIEKIASKNEAFEIAAVVVEKKKEFSPAKE